MADNLLSDSFWKQLDDDFEIGSESQLPFIQIKDGLLVKIPLIGADGELSGKFMTSLFETDFLPTNLAEDWILEPALVLHSIYLPADLQRKGLGTLIISKLEARAKRLGKSFAVAVLTTDEMANLCKKLGFANCAPFSAYRTKSI